MIPDTSPHVVLLAAGLGTRLWPAVGHRPKPLVEVGDRSLLARCVGQLEKAGLRRITVVIGFEKEAMLAALADLPQSVETVENPRPAETGSMRSLAVARASFGEECPDEVLVVEGDLLFGSDALPALLSAPPADAVVLTSSPTGAGDEVWVCGEHSGIGEIAKVPTRGLSRIGELVGLTRISRELLDAMVEGHFREADQAAMEHYEERLSILCGDWCVSARLVEGLIWAEIDDARHLQRASTYVLPRLSTG